MGFLNSLLGKKQENDSVAKVKDPVCGMEIDPNTAAASLEKDGQIYYFCSQDCKEKFSTKGSTEHSQHKSSGCCG